MNCKPVDHLRNSLIHVLFRKKLLQYIPYCPPHLTQLALVLHKSSRKFIQRSIASALWCLCLQSSASLDASPLLGFVVFLLTLV